MTNLKYLFALGTIVFMASCSPVYYIPNTHNVPAMSEQGEFVGAVAGTTDRADIMAAYAISDNIGVLANASLFFPKDNEDGNGGSGQIFEGGIGYFTPIGDNDFLFETYGILGMGKVENHYSTTSSGETGGKLEAGLFRAAIQPALSYKRKYFSASVSTRFSYLNYTSVKGDLLYQGANQIDYLNDVNSQVLFEPAFTLRAGIEQVKLQAQIGTSLNLSHNDFRQGKEYITLGILLNLK